MADPIDLALYTVGWIAPMALELAPAVALLDEYVKIPIPEDGTLYHAGRVVDHHVVMVVCPRTGTSPASATVANLCRSFPNIKHVLVVGIAGGIPRYGVDDQEQVVLGDIIVGVPQNRDGGVAHYEFGAWDGNGNLSVRGHMLHPSRDLLIALNNLRNAHMQKGGSKISQFLGELRNRLADNEVLHFQDPGPEHDHCFNDDYAHSDRARSCQMACDFTRSIRREERGQGAMREADNPRVHYGTIGSANTLIISSTKRNELSSRHNIICFEMESAGVMSEQQGLVIRGISDYADSHKNKRWQKYAAATAASCAKELLLFLPKARLAPREVSDLAIYKQGERRALNSIRGGVHQVISTGSGNHIIISIQDSATSSRNESTIISVKDPWFQNWDPLGESRLDSTNNHHKAYLDAIIQLLATGTELDHQEAFQLSSVQRNRRRLRRQYVFDDKLGGKLQLFSQKKEPCLMLIEAPDAEKSALRDVSTDLVEVLTDSHVPVLWVLDPAFMGNGKHLSITIILRSLCLQAVNIIGDQHGDKPIPLTAAEIEAATTPQHWLELLCHILSGLKRVYVVVNTSAQSEDDGIGHLNQDDPDWQTVFERLASTSRETLNLKMVLLSTSSRLKQLVAANNAPTGMHWARISKQRQLKIRKRGLQSRRKRILELPKP